MIYIYNITYLYLGCQVSILSLELEVTCEFFYVVLDCLIEHITIPFPRRTRCTQLQRVVTMGQ
jgi:hypothetical protein